MNGIFSWKDRSAQILSRSFKVLKKKHSLDDEIINKDCESENDLHTDDEDEEEEIDDIKTADNTVFEMSTKLRAQALEQQPDLDLRLCRWRELTNIDVSPRLPPRQSLCFSDSAQQVLGFTKDKSSVRKILCQKGFSEATDNNQESRIKFKFQYLIVSKRLKVTIIEVTNLLQSTVTQNDLSVSIEVSLMPGKMQKQVTQLCKGTHNPVFDSVMFFNRFTLDEMHKMCLRLKIIARNRGKGTVTTLGEVTVSLNDFDIVAETMMEEFVDTRIGSRSGCIESFRARTLRRN